MEEQWSDLLADYLVNKGNPMEKMRLDYLNHLLHHL
jgi:hypothetical protein